MSITRQGGGDADGDRSDVRQPRVLQVVDSLAPAGAQRIVLDVAELLTDRKVAVTVLSLAGAGPLSLRSEAERAGARMVEIHSGGRRGLLDARRFARVVSFVRRGQFDLVQTHLCYANTIGCIAARLSGAPAVATLHSARRQHDGLKDRLEALAIRSSASMVVAVGASVAEAHRGRVPDGRMTVLPTGVRAAVNLTPEQRRSLRVEVTGDEARPLLLAAGRLAPEKGHTDILRALELVRRQHPSAFLAIAGSGEDHRELTELIETLGLQSSVRLLGWREDLPQLLMAADAYVSGSLWEGLPIAVLQAMAAGRPVVATSVGEVPRLLGQDRGWLVQASDVPGIAAALSALLSDPVEARRRGEVGRRHIDANYGFGQWAHDLITLYQSLVPSVAWDAHPGPPTTASRPCAG